MGIFLVVVDSSLAGDGLSVRQSVEELGFALTDPPGSGHTSLSHLYTDPGGVSSS